MARTMRYDNQDTFSRSRVRHDIRTNREATIFRDLNQETEDLVTEYYDVRRLMDKL